MTTFAFVGFGELGSALAEGLSASGRSAVRAHTRPREAAAALAAQSARFDAARTCRCDTLVEAVGGAEVVHAVVPGSSSLAVAHQCAPLLACGAYYVDLTAASVSDKQAGEALIAATGALYVDGAVLGTVATSGAQVPILASGPGACGWRDLVAVEGLNVDAIDAPSGDASRVKLLRSVYMKGRDALVVETMLAARRYGLEDRVARSIPGPGEQVTFAELADRVLKAMAIHAGRRSEELRLSAELVTAAGVAPRMARAGVGVLAGVSALGLRERFGGERPATAREVLDALDSATPPGPWGPPGADER